MFLEVSEEVYGKNIKTNKKSEQVKKKILFGLILGGIYNVKEKMLKSTSKEKIIYTYRIIEELLNGVSKNIPEEKIVKKNRKYAILLDKLHFKKIAQVITEITGVDNYKEIIETKKDIKLLLKEKLKKEMIFATKVDSKNELNKVLSQREKLLQKLKSEKNICEKDLEQEIQKKEVESVKENEININIDIEQIIGLVISSSKLVNPSKKYEMILKIDGQIDEIFNLEAKKKIYEAILEFLKENEIVAKISNDKIIINRGDDISKFLEIVGAHRVYMEFEQVRVEKEYKNDLNRTINFEVANLDKMMMTASNQLHIISKVRKNQKIFNSLTLKQKQVIEVREKNMDLSLTELAEKLGITKSSISNRFKGIEKIVEKIEKEENG